MNDKPANAAPDANTGDTVIGEGGESGDIIPGQSLVFATLEVCLCALLRHLPNLNPASPCLGLGATWKQSKMTEDASQLIGCVVQILGDLPGLCSPAGKYKNIIKIVVQIMGDLPGLCSPAGKYKNIIKIKLIPVLFNTLNKVACISYRRQV